MKLGRLSLVMPKADETRKNVRKIPKNDSKYSTRIGKTLTARDWLFIHRRNNTLWTFLVREDARRLALDVRRVMEGTTKSKWYHGKPQEHQAFCWGGLRTVEEDYERDSSVTGMTTNSNWCKEEIGWQIGYNPSDHQLAKVNPICYGYCTLCTKNIFKCFNNYFSWVFGP